MHNGIEKRDEPAADRSVQATLHPNAHWNVLVWAALCNALAGRRRRGRALFSRARAQVPGYDIDDFFKIFRFRSQDDIRRITKAFRDLQT